MKINSEKFFVVFSETGKYIQCFVLIGLFVCFVSVTNSIGQEKCSSQIENLITELISIDPMNQLHITKNYELTERLILTQDLIRKEKFGVNKKNFQNLKIIDIYNVSPGTYGIKNGKVNSFHIWLHSDKPEWLVAVDSELNLYKLNGFTNSTNDFNRLVEYLDLKITDIEFAEHVFNDFIEIAAGHGYRDTVFVDVMYMQSLALQDFSLRYSKHKRNYKYKLWWEGVPFSVKSSTKLFKSYKKKDRFIIDYHRYDQGKLINERMEVLENGKIRLKDTTVLYSRNS